MLMKRDDESEIDKREFTQAQRDAAEEKGHAMRGGGYPINTVSDLKNAMQALGRAKNRAATIRHIKEQARRLHYDLPKGWPSDTEKSDGEFGKVWSSNAELPAQIKGLPSEAQSVWRKVANGRMKAGASEESAIKQAWSAVKNGWDKKGDSWVRKDDAEDNVIDMTGLLRKQAEEQDTNTDIIEKTERAAAALQISVRSIIDDDEVVDKAAAIAESLSQYNDYIAGFAPDTSETDAMTNDEIKKHVDDAVAAALKVHGEKIEKLEADNKALADENAVLKMSDRHKAFHDGLDSQEAKDKFKAMSPEERDAACNKAKKSLDPEIQKRLDDAEQDRKALMALVEKDERATYAKRAEAAGMKDGEVLRKAYKGDPSALQEIEREYAELHKALDEARKSGMIFKEFGSRIEKSGSTAMDELNAKAAEVRKSDPKLSQQQAFAKVYNDPENRDLVERNKREENSKKGIAA
jgi:cation transport regulator ChaB